MEAIFTTPDRKKAVDQTLCVKCGECMVACPKEYNAVRKVSPPHLAPVIERPEPAAGGGQRSAYGPFQKQRNRGIRSFQPEPTQRTSRVQRRCHLPELFQLMALGQAR